MSFLDTLPELRRERLKPQDAPDQIAWLTRWQAQETIRLSDAVRLLEAQVDALGDKITEMLIATDVIAHRAEIEVEQQLASAHEKSLRSVS
jgi:NTP pyrophosphatase (non-canonical NTP hydrolase)